MEGNKTRKKFREIFNENSNEELKLLFDIDVKGKKYSKGHTVCIDDELGGVNFHKYRYLDLAVIEDNDTDEIAIVGFYPSS
jgi:hypothetical protein